MLARIERIENVVLLRVIGGPPRDSMAGTSPAIEPDEIARMD
jgi:hypothetical protein